MGANAHKTRDASCLGLSAVISTKSLLFKCALHEEITKNLLKLTILGFKVVQGHQCRYFWKAH